MTSSEVLITMGLSMAPIAELRGGLPYALSCGASAALAYVVSVAANLLVIPVLLLGLGWIERFFRRWTLTARAMDVVFARTRRKGRVVERLGSLGLILLVAIPLPGTGAWTGAIASSLLGIPFRRASALIAVGVLIAGGLVLLASLGAFRLFGVA